MVQDPHLDPIIIVYLHSNALPNLQTAHETKIYKRFSWLKRGIWYSSRTRYESFWLIFLRAVGIVRKVITHRLHPQPLEVPNLTPFLINLGYSCKTTWTTTTTSELFGPQGPMMVVFQWPQYWRPSVSKYWVSNDPMGRSTRRRPRPTG